MPEADRYCTKCGKEGGKLEDYVVSKRHKYGRKNECKKCFNKRARERQRRMRARRRAKLDEMKDEPCADCGEEYPPYVMDFDHVNGDKEFAISQAIAPNIPAERIEEEVAKCEVVCANCHRIRTHSRREDSYAG